VTIKVGDKVRSSRYIEEYALPARKVGVVVHTYPSKWTDDGLATLYPYEVCFEGEPHKLVVDRGEIEPYRSRVRMFLDRFFPARNAEEEFGTKETVEAFEQVQKAGKDGRVDSHGNPV
jgi:hypothetical protein